MAAVYKQLKVVVSYFVIQTSCLLQEFSKVIKCILPVLTGNFLNCFLKTNSFSIIVMDDLELF